VKEKPMPDSRDPFRAVVVERTHQITLNSDPDEVFPLFGPAREADWAAGWEPDLVTCRPQEPQPGCVFRTYDSDRGETIWLLSRLDRPRRRIEYVKTTPASDLSQIAVTVSHAGEGSASAEVTYRMTGLSAPGNAYVASFTDERYRRLIEEWATAINHYLTTGEQRPTGL
jgi:hypothetical protein